jgi:hypothetical protein
VCISSKGDPSREALKAECAERRRQQEALRKRQRAELDCDARGSFRVRAFVDCTAAPPTTCERVERVDGVHFRELFQRLPTDRAADGDQALARVLELARQA